MGRKISTITLTEEERAYLETQTRARTMQAQTVSRAHILLLRADGTYINDIAEKIGINRRSVMLCLNKFKEDAGFMRLSTIHKSTVHTILDEAEIKPFRIKYYCENRDSDFEAKMHNVLLVYKQLSLQFDDSGKLLPFDDGQVTHILSFDEKPGIQAIAPTSEDLFPDDDHGCINRDYEYKRWAHFRYLPE